MLMTYVSEKVNQRAYMGIFSQIWFLPCLIALLLLPISTSNPWTTYAILTTLLSYPTPHPIQVGWCSRISNSTRTRTVSAALYNMFVQVQSIISSNIYRQDDIPDYSKPPFQYI
jgi:predicted MFS family arabinose efflux permease